jgi:hypothetical protein
MTDSSTIQQARDGLCTCPPIATSQEPEPDEGCPEHGRPLLCAKVQPHEPHATSFRVWAKDGYYDVPGRCPGVAPILAADERMTS